VDTLLLRNQFHFPGASGDGLGPCAGDFDVVQQKRVGFVPNMLLGTRVKSACAAARNQHDRQNEGFHAASSSA
jgi:hypothetical protein